LLTSILQPSHLILVLVVALLVLGPKRLPDAGRALGQGLREFKASIGGNDSDEST
jgi:sec-independent protein translocase protein TatA